MLIRIGKRTDAVFLIFFASGFGGLIYQSIWSHYAKLFLGHAAYAQTLVLVVFIGGLAIGSWICSQVSARLRNPLRTYAIVEIAIGLAALVSHKVFVGTIDWSFATLLPSTCSQASTFCATQWLVTASLLLPQSILLGATFPLVTSAVLRLEATDAGHHIAMLYFVNSFGAVLGVLASAFILIPALGLPGTLTTAGSINVLLGLAALALSRGIAAAPGPVRVAEPLPAGRSDGALLRLLMLVALLTGLSSFIYEIVWIRMLSLVLGASTHSFELMLASFILGLALGGLWIRNRVDSVDDPVRFLGLVQLAMGAAAAATIPLYAGSFDFMAWLLSALSRTDGGYILFSLSSTMIALVVMLPATFCAGMTLPLITYRLLRSSEGERAIGRVYAVNTLGGILGVLVGVHLLVPWMGLRNALVFAAAIDILLGATLLLHGCGPEVRRRALRGAIPATAGIVALVAVFATIDPRLSGSGVFRTGAARLSPSAEVLFHRDGKTATVSVVGDKDYRSIRTNGKPDAAMGMRDDIAPSFDEYTMALLAILPLAHQPEAKTAAVIGFGSGMSTSTLLASPKLQRVDTIEIEPAMVEGARAFLPLVAAAYDDPRSRIVIDDAKSYFARGSERYDILVSEPSNPWVSGVASLFTQEFYARLARYLNDGGVLAQWLHTYEMDSATLASILAAVSTTFPDYVIYSSIQGDVVLIARKGGKPGVMDPSVVKLPGLQRLVRKLKLDDPEGVQRRRMATSDSLGALFGRIRSPANSDYYPFVEQRASRTRFTQDTVGEFNALSIAVTPMREMLDGLPRPDGLRHLPLAAAPIDTAINDAWKVHDAIVPAKDARENSPPVTELNELAAQLVRRWIVECPADLPFERVLPSLVTVAERSAAALSPEVADEIWRQVRSSACAGRLDRESLTWLDLFQSTAQRNSSRMVAAGTSILASAKGSKVPSTEYAYLATLTGLICEGEAEAARKLSGEAPRYLRFGARDTELHFLQAFAYAPTQVAACLAKKG